MNRGTKVIITAGPYAGKEGEIVCQSENGEYKILVYNVAVIQFNDKFFKTN